MVAVKLVFGLLGLVVGGEFLIWGATRIASAAGVSALIIGLTIVAMGTSSPELVVSLHAGLTGNANIAVANVVGSNSFNVLFILGMCGLLAPLFVSSQLIKIDVPVMIVASFLVFVFSWNGNIGWLEGACLLLLAIVYTVFLIVKSRSEKRSVSKEFEKEFKVPSENAVPMWRCGLSLVLGVAFLVIGGKWLVEGAIILAKSLGISDTVVGLTLVAAGTSLPEVATSLLATWKGERDIAIGNVVGSNIYNILGILGLCSVVTPGGLQVSPSLRSFDIPVMIGSALLCFPIFFTGMKISRKEGLLFLAGYIAYLTFLVF